MLNALKAGRISHAYFISGGEALPLAREAAAVLLCARGDACGGCTACSLLAAGTHPDLVRVCSEKSIGVNEIRAATALASLAPRMGGRRVVWIENAQTMTAQAQNALLKTLEEPPAGVTFLLSGTPGGLLATILSRCVCVRADATPRSVADFLVSRGASREQAAAIASFCGAPDEALVFFQSEDLRRMRANAHSAAARMYARPQAMLSYYMAQSDLQRALGYQAAFFVDAAAAANCQVADCQVADASLFKRCPSAARCLALAGLCMESARRLAGNANARLCVNRLLILAGRLAESP